jgi:pimeloyl-ACP methyl ester carboxylesterase
MRIPIIRTTIVTAALLAASGVAAVGQGERGEAACTALSKLQIPGVALSDVKTQWFPAGSPPPPEPPYVAPLAVKLPAYCRLDATLDKRTGADGKPYGIGFAVTLPAEWNGRFLLQGGGGLNGSVMPPLGRTGQNDAALARGFAVASTDTGHKGQVFDAAFMQEQQASLDFAYQAIGRVAALARQIISQHYGKASDRSYFSGCSTGGREAMLMAQRYPTYFDGIVVGAPAMRTNFSGIGDEWVATMLNQVAPRDAAGKPDSRRAFSDADRKTVIDGLLNACDAADGLKDGMVFNTAGCRFDPKALVCPGPKSDGCLSKEQVSAIEKAFAGPKDTKGRQVYPGFPFDTGIIATQGIPGLLAGSMNPVGPPFTATEMDVDKRAADAANDPQMIVTATSTWTNMNTFSGRGGKLIFYHGVSDPWFSALDTVDYYDRMTKANGGEAKVTNWSRLFLVPGMGHCGGGSALDSFDMLAAIVDWVERGIAPASVTATGRALPGRSRPLCPYPQHAHYKGSGDPNDAANFECRGRE